MKKSIIEYLLLNASKQDILKILLIGSNGVNADIINSQKDIDFVFITEDSIDPFSFLKSHSILMKSMILEFNMSINIYPINERIFLKEDTAFLRNIKKHNEIVWIK